MHDAQAPYRELHDVLLRGGFRGASTLGAWLDQNRDEVTWLRDFRRRHGPTTDAAVEDLWRLYALSRVLELLLLAFQRGNADGSDWSPEVTRSDLVAFANDLGLRVRSPTTFSPFDCEVVVAQQASAARTPITLDGDLWPCLMLGDMMVVRAGVAVRGGEEFLDAKVATSSTLYWAYRRKGRAYQDLSHGWGSNSQWRTKFRRDYRVGSRTFYNVDGKYDLGASVSEARTDDHDDGLTCEERIELLTHRCFVKTKKDCDDRWPYDDKLSTVS